MATLAVSPAVSTSCAECGLQTEDGLPGIDAYAGVFFCATCWNAWNVDHPLPAGGEAERDSGAAGPTVLPGQAVHILGRLAAHPELGDGVSRATVVDPYDTRDSVLVDVRLPSRGGSERRISVARSRLAPHAWASINAAAARAAAQSSPAGVTATQEPPAQPPLELAPVQAASLGSPAAALQAHVVAGLLHAAAVASKQTPQSDIARCRPLCVCDLGSGAGGDALRIAESLDAAVDALEICEEVAEVLEAPRRGEIYLHCPFDMLWLCDTLRVEALGWRGRFDLFWANASLQYLEPAEFQELLPALRFCARGPGTVLAMVLPAQCENGEDVATAAAGSPATGTAWRVRFSEEKVRTLLRAGGWEAKNIEVVKYCGSWLQVEAGPTAACPSHVGPAALGIARAHEHGSHVRPGQLAQGGKQQGAMPDKFLRFPRTRMLDLRPDGADGWVSALLRDACGITTWKCLMGQQVRWPLRANPSAGALYPNEVYAFGDCSTVPGWDGGGALFHYHPFWHALELVFELPRPLWRHLQEQFPDGAETILVAVTALYWRTAWKYGDVAFHAVERDTGHVLACLAYAALASTARCCLIEESLSDDDLAGLLGLHDRSPDAQQPQALLAITHGAGASPPSRIVIPPALLAGPLLNPSCGACRGQLPQCVADGHYASWKACAPVGHSELWTAGLRHVGVMPSWAVDSEQLRRLIAGRRSVIAFDRGAPISCETFFDILHAALPDAEPLRTLLPFRRPMVPLVLLAVHRVYELPRGLYALVRDPERLAWLKSEECCSRPYLWTPVDRCPAELPLLALSFDEGLEEVMATAALGQPVAQDGAIAATIFVEYEPAIRDHGAWIYRRLIWEASAVSHAMWLAAEAAGLRAAAVGAFFGSWTHDVLGIDGCQFRDMYHLNFGTPGTTSPYGDDAEFEPPYSHLAHIRRQHDRDIVDTREWKMASISLLGHSTQRAGMPCDW